MPAGLLREWLWCVLERESGCDGGAYCCAFVWIGCGCMLVADAGPAEFGAVDLTFAPAPGCREPGTLFMLAPGGWEADWPGVAWWRLKVGGGLAERGCCGCW